MRTFVLGPIWIGQAEAAVGPMFFQGGVVVPSHRGTEEDDLGRSPEGRR